MIRKAVSEDFTILTKYYREFVEHEVDIFESNPFSHIYVYEKDREIAGFINYSIIYDRAELEYIYVDEKYRGNKIASELMELMITDAIDNGCDNITLEVSNNNELGINLYKKYGFMKVAERKNYYKNSDAILMMKELIVDE